MATDIKNLTWNSSTVDVVAVQVTLVATDRTGTARALGAYEAGVLPKGAIIQEVYLDVTTAFNGTLPTILIGVTSDTDKYMVAGTGIISSVALIKGVLALDTKTSIVEDIILTLGGSTTSTVGEATVYIKYIDTAARREIFTV